MKIDIAKLDATLARRCKNICDLQGAASLTTFQRIRSGIEVKPKTAGRIAKALDVDVSEIIVSGGGENNHAVTQP